MTTIVDFDNAVPATQRPPRLLSLSFELWILGSRFTKAGLAGGLNEFGHDPADFDLSKLPNKFDVNSIYSYVVGNSVIRDVNYYINYGSLNTATVGISPFVYKYLNASTETYYEFRSVGSTSFVNDTLKVSSLRIQYLQQQITEFSEYLTLNSVTVLGTIMAAFQLLLITSFVNQHIHIYLTFIYRYSCLAVGNTTPMA